MSIEVAGIRVENIVGLSFSFSVKFQVGSFECPIIFLGEESSLHFKGLDGSRFGGPPDEFRVLKPLNRQQSELGVNLGLHGFGDF